MKTTTPKSSRKSNVSSKMLAIKTPNKWPTSNKNSKNSNSNVIQIAT